MVGKAVFKGARLAFLKSSYEQYVDAREAKDSGSWLKVIYAYYWRRFSWTLEDTLEEPTEEHLAAVEKLEKSWTCHEQFFFVPEDENDEEMDDIEWEKKCTIKTAREVAIQGWFYREYTKVTKKGKRDPWKPILDSFFKSSGKRPACQADWVVYGRLHYEDRIKETYEQKWEEAGKPKNQSLKIRNQCIKAAFENEPELYQKEMKEKARAEHQKALRMHRRLMDPDNDPEAQDELIRRMPRIVKPLLEVIAEHTGMKVSLLAGKAKGDNKFIFTGAHVGVTLGEKNLTWDMHDPDGWRQTGKCFAGFLNHTIDHGDAPAPTFAPQLEIVQEPLDAGEGDEDEDEDEDDNNQSSSDAEDGDRTPRMKKGQKNKQPAKEKARQKAKEKSKSRKSSAAKKAAAGNATVAENCRTSTRAHRSQPADPTASLPTPVASPSANSSTA
ncbi:hypothetical protein BD410DRAFT_846564, partial [Rickenella mellea]